MMDRRLASLRAALGFVRLTPAQIDGHGKAIRGRRGLSALHSFLDSWSGVGHVVVGLERRGYRLSLKKYANGDGAWVASFNRDVMLSADGFGSGATPWHAVQRAAWVAVRTAS